MKLITSLSQNKDIKESLDSMTVVSSVNPLDSITSIRSVNPFTELLDVPRKQERIMPVQTSIYNNYITIDSGSGYTLAKRYAIPEEYWEKSLRTITGIAKEDNEIVMDTMARNVKVFLGGGNFVIKILW
ncbi:hypothetical protein ACLB2K_028967 [Fragaria x ananassa]